MQWNALLTVVLATTLTLGCNKSGTDNDTVGTSGATTASAGDRDFVDDLSIGNMAEVELGKLANERTSHPEVKQFADMMIRDHTSAGHELKDVAQRHAIPVPGQLDERHNDLKNKLSALRGAEFDREYVKAMVEGHEDVVDRLQTRTTEHRFGDDKGTVEPEPNDNSVEASLNLWAARALPIVRHHLEEAKRINDSLDTSRQTRR